MKLFTTTAKFYAFPIAFDPGKPGWKLDKDGKIEMKDGNPVYVDGAGNEGTIDGGTISRLNGEAKSHRERAEAAETKLKSFEGIADPAAAIKAIETVSKLDARKLIDAGEVDKVRDEISKGFTAQIAERDEKLAKANGDLNNLRLSTAFNSSKFIQTRIAVPVEMFQATFGQYFKNEDGKIVAVGADGNKIYSKKRIGELADMDEAIEMIVENYPHKDSILKAPNNTGGGNTGGGGGSGNGRFISRAEFNKLDPNAQAATAASAGKGEVTITD